jgi:uncharacterized protein HemY
MYLPDTKKSTTEYITILNKSEISNEERSNDSEHWRYLTEARQKHQKIVSRVAAKWSVCSDNERESGLNLRV